MKYYSNPLALLIAVSVFSSIFCSAQYAESLNAAGKYIFYNGTVSGSVSYSNSSSCSQVQLRKHDKTYFYIGKYPPWDPNPFFFELYHLRTEGEDGRPGGNDTSPSKKSKRQFIEYTDDSIFNLDFSTAAYVCMKDDHGCGYLEFDPYYVGVDVINLNASKIERVNVGSDLGYTVTGDQSAWTSNNTIQNDVDIASSCVPEGDSFVW
jgi:hypothetical protein